MAAFPARDRDAFIAHWAKILGDAKITKKAILFGGQMAGNIVSFEQAGVSKVGYWIGRTYWGKGVATSALSEFLGHVKERPLYAHVAKHNVASIRVLTKCGFAVCGEVQVSDIEGETVDEFILKLGENDADM